MWEWLAQGKNLQGLGTLVGAGGSIYGGIKQSQAANKMIDLQNKQFAFNKSQILAENADKKKEKDAYKSAFGTSATTGIVAL